MRLAVNQEFVGSIPTVPAIQQESNVSVWKETSEKMPEGGTTVLIRIKSLGEHGVVSAWWYDGGCEESCWVVLDDEKNYDRGDVDYWREMIELPPVE